MSKVVNPSMLHNPKSITITHAAPGLAKKTSDDLNDIQLQAIQAAVSSRTTFFFSNQEIAFFYSYV